LERKEENERVRKNKKLSRRPVNKILPKESKSQRIGQFAVKAFEGNNPLSWRIKKIDGDDDVGIDIIVQALREDQYRNLFHVQVKGSERNSRQSNNHLNANKTTLSVLLKTKTINYYNQIEGPIMLVFADLIKDKDPRNCSVYYLWVNEKIKKLLEETRITKKIDKKSRTVHIPIENLLTKELDISPYLDSRLEKKDVLNELYCTVEEKCNDPVNSISQIGKVFKTNRGAIPELLNPTDSPWLDPPKNSIAWQLKKISEMLFNSQISQRLIDKLQSKLKEATSHELSEFYYLKGCLTILIGQREEAIDFFKKAHKTSRKIKKYHLAYLESRIPYERTDDNALDKIIDEIGKRKDIEYLILKAKLLGLKGNYEAAFSVVERQNEKDIFILKAFLYLLAGSYNDCIAQIEKAFSEQEPTIRQELALRSLKARSLFSLGLGSKIHEGTKILFTGSQDMDPEKLRLAWTELLITWDFADQLGYPSESETIVDMLTILGMYFAEPDIVLKHLIKLAEIRPGVINIQQALLEVAVYLGDTNISDKQLAKVPKTLENEVTRIIVAFQKKDKQKVISLTKERLKELVNEKPDKYDMVIAFAAECANELIMKDEENMFLEAISRFPDSGERLALHDFNVAINENPLKRFEAIENLYSIYKQGSRNDILLAHLFHFYDPNESAGANKIVEISGDIILERDLSEHEYVILCHAKTTLRDWHGVLALSEKAHKRFSSNSRLKALLALALDEIGETARSIALLEDMATKDKCDPLAFEIYINISARCGLVEKAKMLTQGLLDKTADTKQRLELLKRLFSIETYINPQSDQLLKICSRYGELCNKNDENEEGHYLLQLFLVPLEVKKDLEDKILKEFQERLENFTTRFPESKLLKAVSVNEKVPEELLSQLEKMTGFTEEVRKWYHRCENLLSRRQYPMPYVIRHKFLLNFSDFLQIWEISKKVGKEYPQYQLTISMETPYKVRRIENYKGKKPFIDEIALVLLYDLGLLEYLFRIFPAVAIAKDAIINLQEIAQRPFSALYAIKAKTIIRILSTHIEQIQQPSSKEAYDQADPFNDLNRFRSAYDPSIHLLYTDDAISRLYICGNNTARDTITTIDIVAHLRESKIISKKEAAEKYAMLCSFGINGTPINYKDILIVIEDDFNEIGSIQDYLDRLMKNKNFNAFISSIWWFKGDYKKMLTEIGQFLSLMIAEKDGIKVDQEVIVAIWYVWYQKVEFNLKADNEKLLILANSFFGTVIELINIVRNDPSCSEYWAKAWSVYNDIVRFAYGNAMDESIENRSKILLAELIAKADPTVTIFIYGQIVTGLTKGTADYNFFENAYFEATKRNVDMKRRP
jgi:hypothetical protein